MTNKIEISLAERLEDIAQDLTFMKDRNTIREAIALLAAPAVERQEHVASVGAWTDGNRHAYLYGEGWNLPQGTKLYTSPPTPVAVVLPDDWQDQLFAEMERRFDLRKHVDDDHMVNDDTQIGVEFARDWICACIDKVKELNP